MIKIMTQAFLPNFFPTPASLIAKMLEGIKLYDLADVADLGSGKGDIVEYIKERVHENRVLRFDCIEINPDLQHILKGKGYRLVHDDILTFNTYKSYDLIIGNLPFSNGDACLQKALDLVERGGGHLRCVVNAETLRNPFSTVRRWCVDKINQLGGEIEYLRDEFRHAERKTGVEVALVKVFVKKEFDDSFILDNLKKAAEAEFDAMEIEPTAIVSADFFEQIVSSFNMECKAGILFIKEYFAMTPYIQNKICRPGKTEYVKPLIKLSIEGSSEYNESYSDKVNHYLRGARAKYWEVLINHPSFSERYTSKILEELHKKLEDLKNYDFTIFNIRELEKELSLKINQGVEDAILAMFDEFSCKHSYHGDLHETNCWLYNGWKTNKSWRINEKIILPMNGVGSYSYTKKHCPIDSYYIESRLADMVKVFQILEGGTQRDARQLVGNQIHFADERRDYKLDLRYFELKFFKKGTCHIKFRRKDLLDKLNIYGSQKKNWLPPSYGKKAYEQMDDEERTVIDEFQGKEAYAEVMKNTGFYLVESGQPLQLAATIG
jgi:Domain of unknown function (DUF4942)